MGSHLAFRRQSLSTVLAKSNSRVRPLHSRRLTLEPLEERTLLSLAPLLVDLEAASDSGLYNNDNLTNIRTPVIDITAASDGDIIRVYRQGTLLGQATQIIGTQYQYTFTAGQLAGGSNSITARSFDGTSESADSPALVITLDTTGPRITASAERAGQPADDHTRFHHGDVQRGH